MLNHWATRASRQLAKVAEQLPLDQGRYHFVGDAINPESLGLLKTQFIIIIPHAPLSIIRRKRHRGKGFTVIIFVDKNFSRTFPFFIKSEVGKGNGHKLRFIAIK